MSDEKTNKGYAEMGMEFLARKQCVWLPATASCILFTVYLVTKMYCVLGSQHTKREGFSDESHKPKILLFLVNILFLFAPLVRLSLIRTINFLYLPF